MRCVLLFFSEPDKSVPFSVFAQWQIRSIQVLLLPDWRALNPSHEARSKDIFFHYTGSCIGCKRESSMKMQEKFRWFIFEKMYAAKQLQRYPYAQLSPWKTFQGDSLNCSPEWHQRFQAGKRVPRKKRPVVVLKMFCRASSTTLWFAFPSSKFTRKSASTKI